MKRLIVAAAIAIGAVVTLAGCTETPTGTTVQNTPIGVRVNPHYVDLPDGRTVLCLYENGANDSRSGGPSCDWANAK